MDLPPRTLFRFGVVVELGLVLVASLIAWLWMDDPLPYRDLLWFDRDAAVLTALYFLPLVPLIALASTDLGRRWRPFRAIWERVEATLGPSLREWSVIQIAILSAAAGVGEEALFRGVLQPLWGFGTSALIFGLLHAVTMTYFVLAFLLGVYFGWIVHDTRNLVAPAIIHAVYDFIVLLLARRRLRREAHGGAAESPAAESPAAESPAAESPAAESPALEPPEARSHDLP